MIDRGGSTKPNSRPGPHHGSRNRPAHGNARRGNPNAQRDAIKNIPRPIVRFVNNQLVINNGGNNTPTVSSNTPKPVKVPNKPRHKNTTLPTIKSNTAGRPYSYNFNLNPQENKHHIDENYFVRKQRLAEEEKYWRENTLEGQIQTEIESVTTTNKNTKLYDEYSKAINSYWEALNTMITEDPYSIDQDTAQAIQDWADKYITTKEEINLDTGEMEETSTFKKGAPPPPVIPTIDGKKIDITDAWTYCDAYDKAINKYSKEQQKLADEGKLTKIAGQDDNPDSWLDVIRYALNPNKSGTQAFKDYIKGYVWNPLVNGDYKALAVNTLWNMGETLDFGLGVRAGVVGLEGPRIAGLPKDLETPETSWWYKNSKSAHAKQIQMMQLGAESLLKGRSGNAHKGNSPEDIENRLKKAGLWEDYLEMKSAYDENFSDYDAAKQALTNIKTAYTDTSVNYAPDTGNVLMDMSLYIASDPTIVLGFAKSAGTQGAKGISQAAVESVIKDFGIRGADDASQEVIDKAIKQFIHNNGQSVLTKNTDKLNAEISDFAKFLYRNRDRSVGADAIPIKGVDQNIEEVLSKRIKTGIDDANFHIIRSFYHVGNVLDKANSLGLKAVFAGPYIPIKSAILTNKAVRNILYKARMSNGIIGDIAARLQYGKAASIARKGYKTFNFDDFEKAYADIKKEPHESWDELDNYLKDVKDMSKVFNDTISDVREGKLSVGEFKRQIDASLEEQFPGQGVTRDSFKDALDDLYKHAPEGDYGRIGELVDRLKTQYDHMIEIEKRLIEREKNILIKDLNKVETRAHFETIVSRYITNTGEYRFSDDLAELIKSKMDYLDGKKGADEFEMSVRQFERKNNVAVDRTINDADINVPKEVTANERFTVKDSETIKPDIDNLNNFVKDIPFENKAIRPLRSYFTKVGDLKNINPNDLVKAINKSLNEIVIFKGLGDESVDVLLTIGDSKVLLSDYLRQINTKLDKEINYKAVTQDELISALKLDNLTTFEAMVSDPRMIDAIDKLASKDNAIGKALDKFQILRLAGKEFEDNPVFSALGTIDNFIKVNRFFQSFKNDLRSIGTLSDRQYYQIIDRLFGITKGSPKDYLNNAFRNPEKFMEDLETLLVAEFGHSKCNLDGARVQIKNLDKELFKDFKNELDDPEVLDMLSSFTEAGHINPGNDVKVQMLYIILKDPSCIKDYNLMTKQGQKVIFSDIETTGFNFYRDNMTSIAFKEWKELDPDNLTLKGILTSILEDEPKVLRRSLSRQELDRISDELLDSLFKNDPKLANTDRYTKLKAYEEFYAKEANDVDIFASNEDFIRGLNQYLTDSSSRTVKHIGGRVEKVPTKVPCLVFHNTNGFDSKFITSKIAQTQVGLPGGAYKHLSDITDNMQNTLARMREIEKDVILTYEEKTQVKEAVTEFAKSISPYVDNFKLLDPRSLEMALYDLQQLCKPEAKSKAKVESKGKPKVKPEEDGIMLSYKTPINGLDLSKVNNLDKVINDVKKEIVKAQERVDKHIPSTYGNDFNTLLFLKGDLEKLEEFKSERKILNIDGEDVLVPERYGDFTGSTSEEFNKYKEYIDTIDEDSKQLSVNEDLAERDALIEDAVSEYAVKPEDIDIDKYQKNGLQANLGGQNSDKFSEYLLEGFSSPEINRIRDDISKVCHDVHDLRANYENTIFSSPYGSMADDVTYHNIMRSAMEVNPDFPWSALSTKTLFDGKAARKFFDWGTGKLPVHEYQAMKQLTDWVDNKLAYDLLNGADDIIEPYVDFYRLIINSVKTYAENVPKFNDFSYLRHLKQPTTAMETYLVAQKIWDDIFRFIPEDFSIKDIEILRKEFGNDFIKGEHVPDKFVQLEHIIAGMDKDSVETFKALRSSESPNVYAISLLDGQHHKAIFRSAEGDYVDYISALETPTQKEYSKVIEMDYSTSVKEKVFSTTRSIPETQKSAIKNKSIKKAYEIKRGIINRLKAIDDTPIFWDMFTYLKRNVFNKRSELYNLYRLDRLTSEGLTKEEFLAEFVFTNGMRKIIPKAGSDLHFELLSKLRNNINRFGDEFLDVSEDADYIFVQVKSRPTLRTEYVNGERVTTATFPGSNLVLKERPEEQLAWVDFDEIMKDYKLSEEFFDAKSQTSFIAKEEYMEELRVIYDMIQDLYRSVDELTNGASVGTLGVLASRSKEQKVIKSLNKDIYDRGIGADYTCDNSLWTGISFDKSLLGDFDNSWKLSSSEDDFDILMNISAVLDEVAGRTDSSLNYVEAWFGGSSNCKISEWSRSFSDDELFELLNSSDDYAVLTLHNFDSLIASSETGYEVRQLKIKDKYSLMQARDLDAICVPYDTALEIMDTINKTEITNTVLKYWTKYMAMIKVGQIVNIGTWGRNWIDATIRAAADEGSLITALGYEFIATKRLMKFMKINKKLGDDVDELLFKQSGFAKDMTFKQYQEIVSFRSNKAVSGGDSNRTKQMLKMYEEQGVRNEALGIDGYRTLGTNQEKFEQAFTDLELDKYLHNMSFKEQEKYFSQMSKERFVEIFQANKYGRPIKLLDGENYFYNEIASRIIDLKSNSKISDKKMVYDSFNKFTGAALTPMSQIEQIVRFSQVLALQDMGLTKAGAYRHVIDTQFNYNSKSLRMKCLEAVVPFATFQYNNVLYWARQLEQNPRMFNYIIDTFGEWSFQDIEDVVDDTSGIVDQSLLSRIAKMGLPIGSGGMYFKLNPSILDAMNWYYMSPGDVLQNIATPLRLSAQGTMQLAGMDQWSLFSDTHFIYGADKWAESLLGMIPFGDTAMNYGLRYYLDTKPYNSIEDPIHKKMVAWMPMLFGAVKAYDKTGEQDFDEWQLGLEEQGKWYDANSGRIVSINEKNEEGLNNPDLSFEDRKILMWLRFGKLFDANQGKFVDLNHYIKGDLNRDWDFSDKEPSIDWYNPMTGKQEKLTQWEYYCVLKQRYFGVVYDMFKHKFVKPGELFMQGLNSDDLDWDNICMLNAFNGYYWDGNQGRFVTEEFLTKGGLNDEHMTFSKLCAYELAFNGKVWDQQKHEFVQVKDPDVVIQTDNNFDDWRLFNNLGFNPTMLNTKHITYVDDYGGLRNLDGKYVITSDDARNQKTFEEILRNYSYNLGRKYSYRSWKHKWYNMERTPIVPRKPYRNGIQGKGKLFGKAYTSSNLNVGIRMAITGSKAYDEYYKNQYNYNYSYHTPSGLYNVRRYDYKRQDNLMSNRNGKLFMYPH